MEHLIQFGVSIDDDKIEKMVIEQASVNARKQIDNAISDYTRNCYGESQLEHLFKKEIVELCGRYKDEIIEKAVKQVSNNLMHTKAITEAKIKLVSEMEKGGNE